MTAGLVIALAVAVAACTSAADEPLELDAEAAPAESGDTSGTRTAPSVAPAPVAAPPSVAAPARPPAVAPTPPADRSTAAQRPRTFEVPSGTALVFTLIDSISTDGNKAGDTFRATLSEDLVIDGQIVIPRNAVANGRVVAVDESGRVSGRARIELVMTTVQAGGQAVALRTASLVAEAEPTRGRDAATIGGGAGVGAVIGGIVGGGRGAVIGGAIGGGGGTIIVLATRGDQIEFPPETRLLFRLDEPARVSVRAASS